MNSTNPIATLIENNLVVIEQNMQLLHQYDIENLKVNRFGQIIVCNQLKKLTRHSRIHDERMANMFRFLVNRTENYPDLIDDRFHEILTTKLSQLPLKPFNKEHKISESVQEVMYQRIFGEDTLAILRNEKGRKDQGNCTLQQHDCNVNPDHQFNRRFAKVQLARALGLGIKAAKGATGTVWLTDIHGTPLHIFKSADEHNLPSVKVKQAAKAYWPSAQLYYLQHHNMAQPRAEVAAYRAAEFFGFHQFIPELVQLAKEMEFDQKQGIVQLFVKKMKTAEDQYARYYEVKDVKEAIERSLDPASLSKLQLEWIFDFTILGNLDRHDENAFVTVQVIDPCSEQIAEDINPKIDKHYNAKGITVHQAQIHRINTIDNANSFPLRHPQSEILRPKNQYAWRKLAISEQPFTNDVIDFVRQNITQERVGEFAVELQIIMKEAYHERMVKRLLERIEATQYLLSQEGATPRQLANIFSHSQLKHKTYQQNPMES